MTRISAVFGLLTVGAVGQQRRVSAGTRWEKRSSDSWM